MRAAIGGPMGGECNCASWGEVSAAADVIRARFGDPHILVHSAAMQFSKQFDELTPEDWSAVRLMTTRWSRN